MDMDMQFLLSAGCPIFLEENLANGGDHLLGGGLDTFAAWNSCEFNPASF